MSRRTVWALRLLVSGVVLSLLFLFVLFESLVSAFWSVPPDVVVLALALFMAGHLVAALKWRLLVHQPRAGVALVVKAHVAGLVANLCLPGVAGGDVVRAGWLIRSIGAAEAVAVASVVDRGVDVVALLALVGCGWLVAQGNELALMDVAGPVAGLAIAGLGVAVIVARLMARQAGDGMLGRLGAATRVLAFRPRLLFVALALSMSVQATFVLVNVWLGAAVGVDVPP